MQKELSSHEDFADWHPQQVTPEDAEALWDEGGRSDSYEDVPWNIENTPTQDKESVPEEFASLNIKKTDLFPFMESILQPNEYFLLGNLDGNKIYTTTSDILRSPKNFPTEKAFKKIGNTVIELTKIGDIFAEPLSEESVQNSSFFKQAGEHENTLSPNELPFDETQIIPVEHPNTEQEDISYKKTG